MTRGSPPAMSRKSWLVPNTGKSAATVPTLFQRWIVPRFVAAAKRVPLGSNANALNFASAGGWTGKN